ncbi:MAG: LamG domain-containing protein [Lentisphaerae bacterium]|nr:LamG domain-containing protein [Lentisphaerota bacterium]
MKKILLSLTGLCLCAAASLAAKPVYHYDFTQKSNIILSDGAIQKDGFIRFDGEKSKAVIPGSENFKITGKGITVACIVRFAERPRLGQDMVGKGKAWLMSRNDNGIGFFGMRSEKKWELVQGGSKVEAGIWAHYAMTVERVHDAGRGWDYYRVNNFINGEKVSSGTFSHVKPFDDNNAPIMLGYGLGKEHWAMKGDIAEVRVYDRFLRDGEVEDLALAAPLVNLKRKDRFTLRGDFSSMLKTLDKKARSAEAKWLVAALKRSVEIGADQKDLQKLVQEKKDVFTLNSAEAIRLKWNENQQICRIMLTGDLAALVMINGKGSCFPLTSLFDRHARKELLSSYGIYWQIEYRKGRNRLESAFNYSDNVSWQASVGGNIAKVKWVHPVFTAEAELELKGKRLETSLRADATAGNHLLSQVTYPGVIFALKKTPQDTLLHMSGELIKNPSVNGPRIVSTTAYYPTGYVPMQFCAYYDNDSGVYFATEDPKAVSKRFMLKGQQRGIELNWLSWAPYKAGQKEYNSYIFSGKGVIETFKGDWYDAAHIYRRFLSGKKVFWYPEVPRKNMAKWFSDNPMWFTVRFRAKASEINQQRVFFYRNYFELPFGIHGYGVWDRAYGNTMTHYKPLPFVIPMVKKMKELGIYFKPYTDSQLWATLDGPFNKSDWRFSSHGKKYAIKNFNGSMNYETYSGLPYAVMCPACPPWQDEQIRRLKEMVDFGCMALYHDEMLAARPFTCYDESHGHLMNDPAMWLHDGYLPIMKRLKAAVPGYVGHDTEGFEEPLIGLQDGFLCWGPPEDVPLYRTVFGPRFDLIGRHFSYVWEFNGNTERRFFLIIGQQFVSGEQMGWCEPGEMINYPQMILFTKKLIHLRSGLLNFFNEADNLRPFKYSVAPEMTSYIWDGEGGKKVPCSSIPACAYGRNDGLKLVIFANLMLKEKGSCTPQINYAGKIAAIWEKGKDTPKIIDYNGSFSGKLDFDPLELKFMLIAEKDDDLFRNEVKRISALIGKVESFKAPVVPENLKVRLKSSAPTGTPAADTLPADGKITAKMLKNSDNCMLGINDAFVTWMEKERTMLTYKPIDFGKESFSKIELTYSTGVGENGGSFVVMSGNPPNTIAEGILPLSGGKVKTITLDLRKKISGIQNVKIRFNGKYCCTFYSWRLIP